jgi:hypothetical protein
MITCQLIKVAWIRNPAPAGESAPGHLACPCGQAPETDYDPAQGNVTCACGAVYTWDGRVVDPQSEEEL